MPFKESPEKALGNSYYIAKKCFLNLEKKFAKNPSLKIKYKEFIDEYANLGHLRVLKNKPEFGYYMPHHAVIREKSETTKLRVVFNASCKTSSGKSLNDIQMVGPVIQSDLISILLRFRKHKYVLTGDIEKMFRQTEIKEQQRHLQLILWRDDETKPIDILQLNTVTYGTASAPFLSTRCLLQLAKECEDKSIACVIENDFYADDLNTGSETVEGLKYIYREVVATLDSAQLPLRKFRTNCPSLFENDDDTAKFVDFNKESSVLGLIWCPKSDNLLFSTDLQHSAQITKRSVISTTAKVFDPLGLLSPCIIVPKILLQQLWSAKLDWDDPVPAEFCKDWSSLLKEFSYLSDINIERWVLCDNPKTIELHCFVDASQQAYAACIYLRSEDCTGKVTVRLLCAKARVAPMNPTTIPRLELCGALLGARLCSKVLDSLQCNISRKVLWSDSMVVLGWVQTPPRDLKVFVCNRVNEINQLTPGFDFRYVPTDQNPADMGSRGVSPKQLKASSLWWAGPLFLANDPTCWPTQQQIPSLPELKIPRHFLVGRPLTSLPSAPINTKSPNRYQLIEKIRQDFWQRWRREFVAELQQRTKWKTRQHELRVGDLVILKEENVPPLQWRLGRVTRLYPGTDGVSRVADVMSSRGTVRRAVNKMCILPSSAPADTTLINDDKDAAENKEA
ncbi:uncharacterized protein LOC126055847 [Helicoverpa armigera]|uniref:uncharacterized protein LOC126055847 n=1 Tax=Helicoverpa armigera TaxID=29058 RepID=UPI00308278DC